MFWDVHASDTRIVALEKRTNSGDLVHVFTTTDPPTHSNSFSLNHSAALRVILHDQHVVVSAKGNNTPVSVYAVQGQVISPHGSCGHRKPEQMACPYLCVADSVKSLLIADYYNQRLQVMDKEGRFSVLEGVNVERPLDVAIIGNDLFVLYGLKSGTSVQRYNIH